MNFFYLFKYYLIILLLLIIFQSNTFNKKNNIETFSTTYKDYSFWKEGKKNKKINIPLSINTLYNNNSLKKNKFDLLSFPNIYNSFEDNLLNNISLIPNIYISNKNFLSKKDISYFNVKTPTTQIFYENSISEQLIQASFTKNIQNNINYSIHYKSLYPKVGYKKQLSSINYFLTTFNFSDKENKYYKIWIHIINNNINNQKNNSIKIIKNIPILLKNGIHLLNNKRIYIAQGINIYNNIYLLNRLEYEKKISIYKEKKHQNIFGNVYINEARKDENYYNKILNEINIKYFFKKNIFFTSGIGFYKMLFYPKLNHSNILLNKINNNFFSIFGKIEYNYFNKLKINLFSKYLLFNNKLKKNIYYFYFKTNYNINYKSKIEGIFIIYNKIPFFNIFSFYKKKYNINNNINISVKQLNVNYINKYINFIFKSYNINNYIFISSNQKIKQSKNILNILNFYLYKFFSLKNIKYNFFIKIQNNNYKQNNHYKNDILTFQSLVTKNCIYYENIIFKKKILFQTGIVFKYFIKNLLNNSQYQVYLDNFISSKIFLEKKRIHFLDYFINIEFFRIKAYLFIQNFNICNFFDKKSISKTTINNNNKFLIKIGLLWNMFT